jgi:low temperature requirement protein LtrA
VSAVVHAGSFMNGAIAMGFAIAGLHFLRFQRETRDRLFVFFAIAFWVLAAERVGLLVVGADEAARSSVYVARLVAFALIIVGVVDKNRRP